MNAAQRFGRYEIQAELGRGGMAVVYHAFDPKSGREVALKVLPSEALRDAQARARFETEIKTAANLEHPAIVPIYDVGEEGGRSYFVMRYMPGGSLAQRLAGGKLSLAEIARVIGALAPALAYAHQKGIIHRDLKPDNILFDAHNEPFLSDFGVAKALAGKSLTDEGLVGTPAYMSPEQARGNAVDRRSDIYSLGAIVYQALTGRQPNALGEPLTDLGSLPEEAVAIIRTAMAQKKEDRYSSPVELARALNLAAFGYEGRIAAPNSNWLSGVKTGLIVAGSVLTVAAVGFYALRNQLFTPAPPEPLPTPAVAPTETIPPALPTLTALASIAPAETLTLTPAPTASEDFTPTAAVAPLASICPADMNIPTPVVNWLNSICANKLPYTLISIPEGATFQVLNPDFSCKAELTRNGKTTLSCGGTPSYTFELKVCQAQTLDASRCQPGFIFDAQGQCCRAKSADIGCTVYKVDIRSCAQ